jgi:hypothetical protein
MMAACQSTFSARRIINDPAGLDSVPPETRLKLCRTVCAWTIVRHRPRWKFPPGKNAHYIYISPPFMKPARKALYITYCPNPVDKTRRRSNTWLDVHIPVFWSKSPCICIGSNNHHIINARTPRVGR